MMITKMLSWRKLVIASAALLTVAVFASCLTQPNALDQSKSAAGQGPSEISAYAAFSAKLLPNFEETYIKVIGDGQGSPQGLVAELGTSACDKALDLARDDLKFRLWISSAFGTYPALLTIKNGTSERRVHVKIENSVFEFADAWRPDPAWLHGACRAYREGGTYATVQPDRELALGAAAWVSKIAPDCEFRDVRPDGWRCALPVVGAALAASEVERLKRTMISTWSRQPYLLARRVAVTMSLAHALERQDDEAALSRICKVITQSLPLEMPVTLASARWQATVCKGSTPERHEAALIGLNKALAEIEFLRKLFENTSKLGILTVRLPAINLPHKMMLVSLKPEQDVASNITKEASGIWSRRPMAGDSRDTAPKACWHPIYAQSPTLLALATQLDLAGDNSTISCKESLRTDTAAMEAPSPEIYMAESITSDTEFVLNNGEAKMLRLPIGSYTYNLQTLPENPTDWDDATASEQPASTGTIVWEKRRPRPFIRTW